MADKLSVDVMNPRGDVEKVDSRPAPRLASLRGKTVGVIDNKKAGARPFLNHVKTLLARDYPDIKFVDLSKNFNEQYRMKNYMDQLEGIEAAIYSTGD
jgi:hypothetical protein